MSRWSKIAIVGLLLALPVGAQEEAAAPGRGQTVADTLEAIQHARVVTRALFIIAHPDDEASTLLTYLPHALGTDTTLLSLTRGDGGQNAIGPEQGSQLAKLRSHELSGAMEFEGPHLYFTRAVDFGFSKTLDETMEIWKGITLPDMVWVIRTLRPTIVINGWGGTHNGHGNHQASGVLTPQAVEAAADPKQFPEQLTQGLQPWKVEMVLDPVRAPGGGGPGGPGANQKVDYTNAWIVPADDISPLWGLSYREISLEGYVHHRSQGVTPNLNSPFFRQTYALRRVDGKPLTAADLALPLTSLARDLPVPADQPLDEAQNALDQARASAEKLDWPATIRSLAVAGKGITGLEAQVKSSHDARADQAAWELDQVRNHIDHALVDAAALKIVSNADQAYVVAGESFSVRADVVHRSDVSANFTKPDLVLPSGWTSAIEAPKPPAGARGLPGPAPATVTAQPTGAPPEGAASQPAAGPGSVPAGRGANAPAPTDNSLNFRVSVPPGAQTPHTPGDWMYPFLPSLVNARVHVAAEGYDFDFTAPVVSRQSNSVSAIDYPLTLVPAISVTLQPDQFVIRADQQPKQLEVYARVHSFARTPASVSVGLEVRQLAAGSERAPRGPVPESESATTPAGWKEPSAQTVQFTGDGDQLVRLDVTPPSKLAPGNYELKAFAKRNGETFETSLEPLPSLPTYLWSEPSEIEAHDFAITVPAGLHIGYIAAGTDAVPDSLRELGVTVDMLDARTLAFGDLSRFDAIVVGLRAYDLRNDLIASSKRLLEYAANGGTVVVQDQRPQIWDVVKPAPFEATIGTGPRVTDDVAEVKFTEPASPLLNFPNKIAQRDFDGWVQERGLYFWEKWDPKYRTVLSMHDPGEKDLTGSLVWAQTGKGYYIYTGLSFSRQLPEGNAGAFRLLVNLISQSRNKSGAAKLQGN